MNLIVVSVVLDFFKKRINCFFSHWQLLVIVANTYTKNYKKSSQKKEVVLKKHSENKIIDKFKVNFSYIS